MLSKYNRDFKVPSQIDKPMNGFNSDNDDDDSISSTQPAKGLRLDLPESTSSSSSDPSQIESTELGVAIEKIKSRKIACVETEPIALPLKKTCIDHAQLSLNNKHNYQRIVDSIKRECSGDVDIIENQWGCVVYTDVFGTQRAVLFNNLTNSVFGVHWKYTKEEKIFEDAIKK